MKNFLRLSHIWGNLRSLEDLRSSACRDAGFFLWTVFFLLTSNDTFVPFTVAFVTQSTITLFGDFSKLRGYNELVSHMSMIFHERSTMSLWTIQGLPSGFDIMYLALVDRYMQIRFGLKVIWES